MKKRFIALLLCCVMLFTLSPSLISAASADDINGTTQSTEGQVPSGEATNPSGTETSTGSQPDATPGNNPLADPQPDANNGNTSAEAENGGSSEENSGKDPASMTDAELYAYVKQLSTDEEIEAFLKQLPEERVNALIAYAQAQEPTVVPETVVFTDAGPFMPPVNVAMKKKLMRMTLSGATEEPADNGLELSKTAVANNTTLTPSAWRLTPPVRSFTRPKLSRWISCWCWTSPAPWPMTSTAIPQIPILHAVSMP